ncbi:NUDIX hydrolase [Sinomonas mesophila]|uniref:NUDIX hydrolase n=1 Tax=Sinomonas mesophila TaxID=1531955 RepID=UPI00098708D4|nr:NUDIX hydrolase [Sinomonas mesophila]
MGHAEETADSPLVGEAATVVLLREAPEAAGVEVLLLERPHSGTFAGAWVFPGGRVDPEDAVAGEAVAGESGGDAPPWDPAHDAGWPAWRGVPPEHGAALGRAAVRETLEETGLALDAAALVPLSHWIPPIGAPKRLRTWFFLAEHPGGEVRLNPGEHVGFEWLTPAAALERHADGDVVLAPPTWMTLHGLREAAGVRAVLAARAAVPGFERYFSHPLRGQDGVLAVMWEGDAQYDDPFAGGHARHRLWTASLPWRYERTP